MEESHGFFHSACLKLNGSVRKNKVSLGISGENSGYPRQIRSVSRTMAIFLSGIIVHQPETKLHGKNSKVHGIFAEFDIRKGIAVGIIEHTCNNMFLAVCQPDRVLGMEIAGLAVQL